ncbi:transketolase [Helcococcus ovis]|uniref:Transketolase n=1 Tax=Helcococcus ovis TaxID=72026 RepID=A0A4R9C2R4_9FIRM|nr:transketolase [Helcococcus ovis]TFF66175.1 transketolase [Helcococcus ovis]TFF66424.1 transketolase [Helcococcus ovis]TFF66521.1 transketolase [Helcococcus ovis]WNZ01678.1 transketolase [Helcococcus ovis]
MEKKVIDTIRVLSAEMVLKANSGHQGTPIGASPIGYVLYNDVMKYNPKNPKWFNRDRFILSAGHASALQYSLLHLFGFDLSMEDIKNFRQLGSKTPGHPEYGYTDGVEVTTGPLGQGVANAVGFAMAEKHLAAKYNTKEIKLIDHYTYVLAGDGCLMEGVSNEASSLAGTLGLGKLIMLYDSNKITIDGTTEIAFSENVAKRYEALGWQVLDVKDANDINAIREAIEDAKKDSKRPTLIEIHSKIGYGTNKENTSAVHGNPLKLNDIEEMKLNLGYNVKEMFTIDKDVRSYLDNVISRHKTYEDEWNKLLNEYKNKYPEKYESFINAVNNSYDFSFLNEEDYYKFDKDLATRASSGVVINKIAKYFDGFFGGSADLAGSNNTTIEDETFFSKENPIGKNIHYGIREHSMAAMANGISLHGGLLPYTGTFLSFADYMKPAIRLSALMHQKVVNIFTHDSIGLGEDGPTHQAVDQLPMLRSIPNCITLRPADNRETAASWSYILQSKGRPVNLILTRQVVPSIENTGINLFKGAYILKDFGDNPEVILMASGSELQLAYKVAEKLFEQGKSSRVISFPSIELFEEQSDEYKKDLLPDNIKNRVCIEASSEKSWYKYLGIDGLLIGMETFGTSAPAEVAFEYFGFTVDKILHKINKKYYN